MSFEHRHQWIVHQRTGAAEATSDDYRVGAEHVSEVDHHSPRGLNRLIPYLTSPRVAAAHHRYEFSAAGVNARRAGSAL